MSIDKIVNLLEEIRDLLKNSGNEITVLKNVIDQPIEEQAPEDVEIIGLLMSEDWPESVPSDLIVDSVSEEDKLERAESMIELVIQEPVIGKKVLDFGCGEGHLVKELENRDVEFSMGYDIEKQWSDSDNLTDDFELISKQGPFDIIVVYDVLDHCADPVEALKQVKSVLKDDGSIYLRCHPFISRHGGHLYEKLNKAFVHLVLTKSELDQVVSDVDLPIQKVASPIMTYNGWIESAGLKKIDEEIDRSPVESFFENNKLVSERIKIFKKGDNGHIPKFQMEQSFIDYVLKK